MENAEAGKRIKLIKMVEESDPVPSGTEGTIYHVGGGVINVKWDNGRDLGIIIDRDMYSIGFTKKVKCVKQYKILNDIIDLNDEIDLEYNILDIDYKFKSKNGMRYSGQWLFNLIGASRLNKLFKEI
jgi:hypothetical protein